MRSFSTFLAFVVLSQSGTAIAQHDLIIRGGRVVDGAGNPWRYADIAIQGSRIVEIGLLPSTATAKKEIDASGLVVAPGFIDMHSHSDFVLFEDGAAQSKIRQGVTTEVLGEDSSGGPNVGKTPARRVKVKGQSVEIRSLSDYLAAIEASGISVNLATYVGVGNVWEAVMGESFDRPTRAQMDEMKSILDQAMRDGGFGLSTMLMSPRSGSVTIEDLVELGKVVKQHGGIYSSHIRSEGTDVLRSASEAIAIGERAGIPVDIIHLKIAEKTLWGRMNELVSLIDRARARGVNVQANVYPYTRGNNDLVSIIPPWAHEGGKDALIARLKNPVERARMKRDIAEGIPGWYNHLSAVGGDWSRMLIAANLKSPEFKQFVGKSMADFQAWMKSAGNNDELDSLFDLLIAEGGSVSTIYAHHEERDMNLALLQPWCSIGSDGSALAVEGVLRRGNPHPRSFGTFPRILGRYVRDRKLLTLEDAIRKMTSLNASKIGIKDRGTLEAGRFADITIFNAERIIDRSDFTDPFHYSEGVEFVIVNGEVVLNRGVHTGARPGKSLRHGR